jgi:hypothetical protein
MTARRIFATVCVAWILLAFAAARLAAQTTHQDQLEKLTIQYGFLCGKLPPHGTIHAKITGLSLGKTYSKDVTYTLPVVTVPIEFSVVPDDYRIQGFSGSNCTLDDSDTAIVLPGHPTVTQMVLKPCCGLATPGPDVAGFVESGLHVEILDDAKGFACSANVDRTRLQVYQVRRDGDAYYGNGRLIAFGDASAQALVRVPDSENETGTVWRGYFRFDVTDAALRENASPGGSVVRCLPAPRS